MVYLQIANIKRIIYSGVGVGLLNIYAAPFLLISCFTLSTDINLNGNISPAPTPLNTTICTSQDAGIYLVPIPNITSKIR